MLVSAFYRPPQHDMLAPLLRCYAAPLLQDVLLLSEAGNLLEELAEGAVEGVDGHGSHDLLH